MKKYISITFALLLFNVSGFSQKNDAGYFIEGYTLTTYQNYFDSVHKLIKHKLNQLDSSIFCFVTFKVDNNHKIDNLEIIESPEQPLNSTTKDYVSSLFLTSNGKWIPIDGKKNKSCKEIFKLEILKVKSPESFDLMKGDRFLAFELYQLDTIKKKMGITQEYIPHIYLQF